MPTVRDGAIGVDGTRVTPALGSGAATATFPARPSRHLYGRSCARLLAATVGISGASTRGRLVRVDPSGAAASSRFKGAGHVDVLKRAVRGRARARAGCRRVRRDGGGSRDDAEGAVGAGDHLDRGVHG